MESHPQPSPTTPESGTGQRRTAGSTLGCMSVGCAILGIISVVPFLGVKYGDWWSGGSGGDDAMRIYSGFLWIFGDAALAIGMILGGAGLVSIRLSSGTWSEAFRRGGIIGPLVCAVSLLVSGIAGYLRWYNY